MIVGGREMEISILISILLEFYSGMLIYNSKVPDTAGRKTRRRRIQAIAKRYAFHANSISRRVVVVGRCLKT